MQKEMLERAFKLGEPQIKSDGTLTFDYWLATQEIVVEYQLRHTIKGLDDLKSQRRDAMKRNDMNEYQQIVLKTGNWEQMASRLVQACLFENLQVSHECFALTNRAYMIQPEKRAQIERIVQEAKDRHIQTEKKSLQKGDFLLAFDRLQALNCEVQKKMFEALHVQKTPPHLVQALGDLEQMKAGDVFFNEFGYESSIISENAKGMNVTQDPDFMAIILKYQKQAQAYTEQKKTEM